MGEYDYTWEIVEVEPHRRLVWKEPPGLLPGETEVTAVFEETDTGSRVRVTQAGFGQGEDWLGQLEGFALGWSQNLANLYLYLRTGVGLDRFFTWRSETGATVTDTPAGPEVLKSSPARLPSRPASRPATSSSRLAPRPCLTSLTCGCWSASTTPARRWRPPTCAATSCCAAAESSPRSAPSRLCQICV
jgi:hypothetical protein